VQHFAIKKPSYFSAKSGFGERAKNALVLGWQAFALRAAALPQDDSGVRIVRDGWAVVG
jgi:hypothetical protein